MTLWLTDEQAHTIVQHALDEAPREACGLIVGRDGCTESIIPLTNIATNSLYYYEVDHQALIRAMFEIERGGLTLTGIYHSHPNGDPIPSQTDITQAAYPDAAYVIVGLRGGEPRFAAWKIRRYEVQSVPLHIGLKPPPTQAKELPNSHRFTILISAILAFVFMMILALSLLPPAPKIP
jgi:proteasome lid subunit RPN8/RPN11